MRLRTNRTIVYCFIETNAGILFEKMVIKNRPQKKVFKKLAFEIGSENWTLEFDLGKLELYFQQLHSKCRMEIQAYFLVVENWGPKTCSKKLAPKRCPKIGLSKLGTTWN